MQWLRCLNDTPVVSLMVTFRRKPCGGAVPAAVAKRRWDGQHHNDSKEDSMATKAELIGNVAEAAGVSKADAEATIGAFFDCVVSQTMKGDKVAWPGFGGFSTTQRSARVGRNPQTGAPVDIPASTAMKFSASSTLKNTLNGR